MGVISTLIAAVTGPNMSAPNPQYQTTAQPDHTSPTKPSKEQQRSLRRELRDNRHEIRRDMKAQRKEIKRDGKAQRKEIKREGKALRREVGEERRGGAQAAEGEGYVADEGGHSREVTGQEYGVQSGVEHGEGSSGPPPGYEQATGGLGAAAGGRDEKTSHVLTGT